jgi:hypothetical protein
MPSMRLVSAIQVYTHAQANSSAASNAPSTRDVAGWLDFPQWDLHPARKPQTGFHAPRLGETALAASRTVPVGPKAGGHQSPSCDEPLALLPAFGSAKTWHEDFAPRWF